MGSVFIFIRWLFLFLILFALVSEAFYLFKTPKKNRNWTAEHAVIPKIQVTGGADNPNIDIKNIRDFHWADEKQVHYKNMQFQLNDIVGVKAVVSHFSVLNNLAHVYMIFELESGEEIGVSVEARREEGEDFSLQGGLFAQFELMYVIATAEDLLTVRLLRDEEVHVYPIKATKAKSQALFMLIANAIKTLDERPQLYHLFFRNCTNQLVKHVSILTDRKYPWYFQTLAPGKTGKMLYDFDLIDMPNLSFDEIQQQTLSTLNGNKK